MSRRRRRRALAALALAAMSGCGYRASLTLPAAYDSIGVELFSNSSLEPDLEAELHVALVRSARELLEVPLVAPGRARLVIRGEMLDYRRRSGIRSRDNVQLETGLTIRARAVLEDSRDGHPVAGPITVSTQIGYTLDRRTVNEADARRRALENLAQRIVLELSATAQPPKPRSPSPPDREGEDPPKFEDRQESGEGSSREG